MPFKKRGAYYHPQVFFFWLGWDQKIGFEPQTSKGIAIQQPGS